MAKSSATRKPLKCQSKEVVSPSSGRQAGANRQSSLIATRTPTAAMAGTLILCMNVSGLSTSLTKAYPPGYTHLHQDSVPEVGGDTLWASGTALYDRFSPRFRSLLDGLNGIYRSAHAYKDENDPDAAPKHVLRVHPLIRTIPATGHKAVFANRAMTVGIEGLDKRESDAILNHIFDVYERSTDLQVRWHWTPGTSAIWDNRSSIHTVSNDYIPGSDRHGTRVSSLAEKPYFDPQSQSRRQALQLD